MVDTFRPNPYPRLNATHVSRVIEMLQPILSQISSAKTMEQLGQSALKAMEAIVEVEFTGFYLLDHSNPKKLRLILGKGLSDEQIRDAESTAMERHPGMVIQNPMVYLSNNELESGSLGVSSFSSPQVVLSRLYCPIISDEQAIGTLGLASSRAHAFEKSHAQLLMFVADLVATAVNNVRAQEASRDSVLRLTNLVDAIHTGVLIEDEFRKVLHANAEFCNIFGIPVSPEQMVGADCTLALDQVIGIFADEVATRKRIAEILQENVMTKGDLLQLKDGRILQRDFIPITVSKTHKGVLWNYQDITQRELAKKELEQERLRSIHASKMASLGELAGGIAHEINSPLAAVILTASQVVELAESGELDHNSAREMAQTIEKTASRIGRIIRSMKAFARDGRADPFVTTPVKQLVDDTLALCGESLKTRNIEMIPPLITGYPEVLCRPTELTQVFVNLINNARDAIEKLDQRWVEFAVIVTEKTVTFTITDSGSGIPKEFRPRMFEPFFTTKPAGRGTGLGLGISKRIAESHGGRLYIDDRCRNTRFVVEIPKDGIGVQKL